MEQTSITRRRLLAATSALPLALSLPVWSQEAPSHVGSDFWIRPRKVKLSHPSGDKIEVMYWSDGELIGPAYQEVCWFMRDRTVQRAVYMSPVLLDINYAVYGWLDYFGVKDPILMTSAHRDYQRNLSVEGAAKDSRHVTGEAADLKLSIPSLQLARFGVWLGGGGVGWYPGKNFTHLDTGRLRTWRG